MTTTLARGPVTTAILTALRTSGFLIGDGVIPAGGGWSGRPNRPGSQAVPYAVLSEITAGHSFGGLGDSQSDWQLPYLLESVSPMRRDQCSALADKLRPLLKGLRGVGTSTHTVAWVHLDSIGEPISIPGFDPPYWHLQDGFTVYLMKG